MRAERRHSWEESGKPELKAIDDTDFPFSPFKTKSLLYFILCPNLVEELSSCFTGGSG